VIAGRRQALGAHSRSERDSSLIDGLEQSGFIANYTIRHAGRRKLNDRSWPFATGNILTTSRRFPGTADIERSSTPNDL
jgi:hypothetical protein